jgi:hypothetical protein
MKIGASLHFIPASNLLTRSAQHLPHLTTFLIAGRRFPIRPDAIAVVSYSCRCSHRPLPPLVPGDPSRAGVWPGPPLHEPYLISDRPAGRLATRASPHAALPSPVL